MKSIINEFKIKYIILHLIDLLNIKNQIHPSKTHLYYVIKLFLKFNL